MAHYKKNNGKLIDEAEAWIVKLRSDDVSVTDKEAFSEWLNRSHEHVTAFDEAYAVWETLGAVSYLPEIETLEQQIKKTSFRSTLSEIAKPSWFKGFRPLQASLAFACVVALFAIVFNMVQPGQEITPTRFETAAGEIRKVELEDGSWVELNTDSILDVVYTDEQRSLNLVQGEIYFSVAKDRSRPFVVDFGRGTATAMGTAFNIYRQDSTTSVIVTEGIVDVREAADLAVPNPDATRIEINQQVKVGRRGVSPIRNLDPTRALAWREKTIIFKDTPLSDAIDQLNRYLSVPAKLEDSALTGQKVSGTFSLTSPDETLDAVTTAFNLTKIHSAADNALYLLGE